MALTHRLIKRIDLEHEPGGWVEVRMPSFNILERAREARSKKVMAMITGMDMTQLKGLSSDKEQTTAEGDSYDKETLLAACVTAWSYEEPVTSENIAELDEVTVVAVVAALVPAESDATRKKG